MKRVLLKLKYTYKLWLLYSEEVNNVDPRNQLTRERQVVFILKIVIRKRLKRFQMAVYILKVQVKLLSVLMAAIPDCNKYGSYMNWTIKYLQYSVSVVCHCSSWRTLMVLGDCVFENILYWIIDWGIKKVWNELMLQKFTI